MARGIFGIAERKIHHDECAALLFDADQSTFVNAVDILEISIVNFQVIGTYIVIPAGAVIIDQVYSAFCGIYRLDLFAGVNMIDMYCTVKKLNDSQVSILAHDHTLYTVLLKLSLILHNEIDK